MTTATLRKRTRADKLSDLHWALSTDLSQTVDGLRSATEDRIHAAYSSRPLGENPAYREAADRARACDRRITDLGMWDYRSPWMAPVVPYAYATAVPR